MRVRVPPPALWRFAGNACCGWEIAGTKIRWRGSPYHFFCHRRFLSRRHASTDEGELREDLVDAAGVARENADAQDADAEQRRWDGQGLAPIGRKSAHGANDDHYPSDDHAGVEDNWSGSVRWERRCNRRFASRRTLLIHWPWTRPPEGGAFSRGTLSPVRSLWREGGSRGQEAGNHTRRCRRSAGGGGDRVVGGHCALAGQAAERHRHQDGLRRQPDLLRRSRYRSGATRRPGAGRSVHGASHLRVGDRPLHLGHGGLLATPSS